MSEDHWPLHARQWPLLGPPLRPSPEDVATLEEHAASLRAAPLRALLLGVTPEIAAMRWPDPTSLLAVDRCDGMIALVWPRAGLPPGARAVRGDWRAVPADDASIDLAIGDGSLSLLPWPEGYAALAAELRRVVRPGGLLALRLFVPPRAPDSVDDVARDLDAGRIASFHVLKWRLVMALRDAAGSVHVADVWDAWRAIVPDPDALAARGGWSPEVHATIDVYRGSPAAYSFPREPDAVGALGGFALVARRTPRYELGERCPTVVLRRA